MRKPLLVLLLLCGISMHAQTTGNQPAPGDSAGAQFTFINNDRGHDFGGMLRNASASYKVEFRNTGDKPLEIYDMHCDDRDRTGPDYSVKLIYPKAPVKPGKKGVISVSFTAGGETGSFRNTIYVTSNATTPNYQLLRFAGAVIPEGNHATIQTQTDKDWLFSLLGPVIMANTK